MNKLDHFWHSILSWQKEHGRSFPWRITNNPYNILIAEFLLQQTNASKVVTAYHQITQKYPSVEELAGADLDYLKEIIRPLGLIYRAERIIGCAKMIIRYHNGKVPDSEGLLIELPGVGPYISNAVLCYAYGKPTVPIDTNVIRLFTRYFDLKSGKTRPRSDPILAREIQNKYTYKNYKIANLAIIDYSGLVCKVIPKCDLCILQNSCFYYQD